MKRLFSILLIAVLCFTFVLPAFADEGEFIIDDALVFEDIDEFIELEDEADMIFSQTKIALCYGTDDIPYNGTIEDAAKNFFESKVTYTDGIFLYTNTATGYAFIYADGFLTEKITEEQKEEIFDAYINEDTYYGGVKAYLETANSFLGEVEPPSMPKMYLADGEQLFTQDEKYEIMSRFIDITEKYEFDVIGLTKTNVGDYAAKEAADYFEDNLYGFGSGRDGVILLISKTSNHEGIAGLGRGESMFPDDVMNYILDEVDVYRNAGNYKQAFMTYADLIEKELAKPGTLKADMAAKKAAEEKANMPKRIVAEVLVSLGLGFLLAFIPTGVMSSKMTSVRMQSSAAYYTRPGSMNVAVSRDIFLYNTVSRTKRVKQSSSSGGGGGTSSSGRSFSGASR